MTSQDPGRRYDTPTEVESFLQEQRMLRLNTALPGLIVSYDPTTRRASVRPALQTLMRDGSVVDPPIIANAPVVFPSGAGWSLTFPLNPGDPVMLVFSQRGLTGFKREHGLSAPDPDALFWLKDAMVIPGFGGRPPPTPVSTTGPVLQDDSGANYIALEPGGIRIKTAGTVSLTDTNGTRTL